jgi:sigma-54 specific flagellar transcriptional regulator A
VTQENTGARGKVLVVDADEKRTHELCSRLEFLNFEPIPATAADPGRAEDGVAVMVGRIGGDKAARRVLECLTDGRSRLPVLQISGPGDEPIPIDGAHIWALDAPLRRSQLEHLLDKAVRYKGRERRMRLTGESRSIRDVRTLIEQVAEFDTTVLVTGESGTGKELVAQTVHELSSRAERPFVPINCGAIPSELLESELFGHEKGAFTGALSSRKGRFELAEGGTLFLDEIGDMSLEMQAKLLRVLQERCFERVGSNETRRCNVRIIAATHRNLTEAVASGEFREDLYYRLNVFPIRMPPLRKRTSDLPALLEELLVQHGGEREGALRLTSEAVSALARYPWPGNIRELSNLVERLAILYPEGEVGLEALPEKYRQHAADSGSHTAMASDVDFGNLNLREHLGRIERRLIEDALARADGVVAQAARLLKLRRTTLVEKLGKYGIAH